MSRNTDGWDRTLEAAALVAMFWGAFVLASAALDACTKTPSRGCSIEPHYESTHHDGGKQ